MADTKHRMQMVTNRIDGARVESRTRSGREWLVAPVVMLCEGVLNGELVVADEFSHHAASWNGRPLMLGHPMSNGAPVSANDPDILEQLGVGQVFETAAGEGKLRAQAWVDVAKANGSADGREVVRRLRAGEPVEVSTAYFRDLEEVSGSWNGEQHLGIARNLKPDHLAFLVHDVGACSIQDGCGCPRVNAEGTEEMNEFSAGTTAADPPMSTSDSADDGHDSGWLQALKQTVTGALRSFFQEAKMDERRKAILDSAPVWTEETLGALSEDQVEWLHGHVVPAAPEPEPAANAVEPVPELTGIDIKALLDEYLAEVGGLAGLKARVEQIQAVEANAKGEIVARLAANKRCVLTEAQLNMLDQETLEGVELSLWPADYRGQGGGPQANAGGAVVEKLNRPSLFEEVH